MFRSKSLICFILITISFIFSISAVYADDGVLGITPEGVYPISQTDIMMEDEEINIQITDSAAARVTCRFKFRNLGGAQSVLMGFPAQLYDDSSELTPENARMVRNFTARDGNGEIPVTLVNTIPDAPKSEYGNLEKYSKWYSFSVDFGKNEEKTLYHTYEISFPYDSIGEVFMGYVLETGASWAGPIGHAEVVFDMGKNPMYTLTDLYPNNFFRIEGNKLIWERSSFEPEYNLGVIRNSYHYSEDFLNSIKENGNDEDFEDAEEKMALFGTSPKTIQENAADYYRMYNEFAMDNPIKALYIKSALGLPDGDANPTISGLNVREHQGNCWYFNITSTDPDGDLVDCHAEVTGINSYKCVADNSGRMFFDTINNRFVGGCYLETMETGSFAVNFMIMDAAGNCDTETMILQADQPGPVSAETSTAASATATVPATTPAPATTPEQIPTTGDETTNNGNNTVDASGNSLPAYKPAVNAEVSNTAAGLKLHEVLIPLGIFTLVACLVIFTLITINRRKKG